MIDKAICQP